MSDISYAVLARAKAKYGKRLKEKDYKALLECKSVPEVMSYLKSKTRYINAFGEANERGIRRRLFENLLRQFLTNEIDTLCRYDTSVGEKLSSFITHKSEINALVQFMIILNSSGKQSFVFTVPLHIAKKTEINVAALTASTNFEEMLEALSGTKYRKILAPYKDDELLPIPEIETKLYNSLYGELYEIIEHTDRTESGELKDLLDTVIDYKNFITIFRLKKYYNTEAEKIKKYLLSFGSLSEKDLKGMCEAASADEVFNIMRNTRQGRIIGRIEYRHRGDIPKFVEFEKARHNMYFSNSPATVMVSYTLLGELELSNLIVIIEGARYNVDRSTIEPLLAY